MDMKKMIQQMTEIENSERKRLAESAVAECGEASMPSAPTNPGNPVTMSVTLNASGKEHVDDLLAMMKAAGLDKSEPVGPQMLPMRQDMDRLNDIMRQSEIEEEELDEYMTEPDEEYMELPKGGGLNREKGAYAAAQDGDNAMAVEGFKSPDEGEYYDDEENISVRWMADDNGDIDIEAYDDNEQMIRLNPRQEQYYKDLILQDLQDQHDDYFDHKMRLARDESIEETIRNRLYKALSEKKKPDADGNGVPDWADKKPGKDDNAGKKKGSKPKKGEVPPQFKKKKAPVKESDYKMSDLARKAASMAQVIKRKINSGDEMDDRDYNQMAELGTVLSRVGTDFGPKSMKDVLDHMIQYTDDRNQEGHDYPEMNVDRFKELLAMAKSTGESMVGEISSDLAQRYLKRAKWDREWNDNDIDSAVRKQRYGSGEESEKAAKDIARLQRKNAKRQTGINRAKKRV